MQYLSGIFLAGILFVLAVTGCSEATRKKLEPTPLAVGSLNQLAIIADDELWNGPLGDSINFYFGSAFPILPQPESLFDLKHFSPDDLVSEPTRRQLKAYLIIGDISDPNSSTGNMIADDIGSEKVAQALEDPTYNTNVGHDRWAKGQLLIYLFASGQQKLSNQIVSKFPSIAKAIQNQYQEQIDASVYLGGPNNQLINQIERQFGIYLKIPSDFQVNVEDESTMWIIREGDVGVSNLLINRSPYESQDQFKKEEIIARLNTLGKKYISTTLPGTYMRINDADLPVFTQSMQLDDNYAVESRGIWEMEGDFLGGPFVSYQILDEPKGELITICGFILAPGEKKRNFVLYLEHIMRSFELRTSLN